MTAWVGHGARAVLRGVLLFGLWMVLVDNLHEPEIVTGVVVAVAAALLGTVVAVLRGEPVGVTPPMLRHIVRPVLLLITDTLRVAGGLFRYAVLRRELGGRFRAVRYGAIAAGPDARARRILTTWAASLGANRYAIGIDRDEGYLLVHQLVETSGPLDPLELG